jgi:hypothetical protein
MYANNSFHQNSIHIFMRDMTTAVRESKKPQVIGNRRSTNEADQMKKKHRDRRIKYKNAPEALFIQL